MKTATSRTVIAAGAILALAPVPRTRTGRRPAAELQYPAADQANQADQTQPIERDIVAECIEP